MRKSGQGNVISPENNMTLQDFISMQILYLNFSQEIVVFIGVMVSDQIGKAFLVIVSWDLMMQLRDEGSWAFGFPLGCYSISRAGGDGAAKMKILSKGSFVNFCKIPDVHVSSEGMCKTKAKRQRKPPKEPKNPGQSMTSSPIPRRFCHHIHPPQGTCRSPQPLSSNETFSPSLYFLKT